jgi:hypothetical protein
VEGIAGILLPKSLSGKSAKASRLLYNEEADHESLHHLVGVVASLRTIRVDEREDVEVIVVEESLGDVIARFVSVNKLFRDILDSLPVRQRLDAMLSLRKYFVHTIEVIHSRACTVPW